MPEGLVGQRLSLTGSVVDVLRTSRMQRLQGQLNKARVNESGHGQVGFDAEGGLIVPLVFRGRTFGVLVALDRPEGGPRFTSDDERLLEALAATAAAAVPSAEPVASDQHRQRIAAAEQERARWARELHDETLQGLATLRLSLSAARRAGSRDVLEDVLQATIAQLETEISSLRALIADLRPPTLDQLGAKAAIEALAERLAQNGFNVDVQVEFAQGNGREGQSHSSELETAIYRIVQESLTNAIKHGHASRGMVEVIESDTTIEVTVRDDGAGFDVIDPTAGFGVLGMRERVELLNGTFEIESSPGQGTSVRATFPVPGRTTG
ncbi:MAG: sensor histidine kinase [Solirubrobacteraceae bacterium]